MNKDDTKLSKTLSLILRHKPEKFGLTLDENGWIEVADVIIALNKAKLFSDKTITIDDVFRVVESNNKKRFALSEDEFRIRANQGHTIDVDVELKKAVPPDVLYHGTYYKRGSDNLESIRKIGLVKMERQHVHLSVDKDTAVKVGKRRGLPCIIEVNAKWMKELGYEFFLSENGVWLTKHVPPQFLNPWKDKADEEGSGWATTFEGIAVGLDTEKSCRHFKEVDSKTGYIMNESEIYNLPCDLNIRSGRRVRVTVDVFKD